MPVFDSKTGGIPHINTVGDDTLASVFGEWMKHFGINNEWVTLDSKRRKEITASFFYCASEWNCGKCFGSIEDD